jgi:hypothetical protein
MNSGARLSASDCTEVGVVKFARGARRGLVVCDAGSTRRPPPRIRAGPLTGAIDGIDYAGDRNYVHG